jgi:hypothetical protein
MTLWTHLIHWLSPYLPGLMACPCHLHAEEVVAVGLVGAILSWWKR